MKIAASRLESYLQGEIEVRVCHANGTIWKHLPGPAVKILADKVMITGVGSASRLRYVILNAAAEVAEDAIERQQRANSIRGRLQNSQASQSCVSDRWSNHIGTVTVYRQVRGWAFGLAERQRQARSDAERRHSGVRR